MLKGGFEHVHNAKLTGENRCISGPKSSKADKGWIMTVEEKLFSTVGRWKNFVQKWSSILMLITYAIYIYC